MKNLLKLIFIILISFTIENNEIYIKDVSLPECYSLDALNKFMIEGFTTEELNQDYYFYFNIIGKDNNNSYNYSVQCSIMKSNSTPIIVSDEPSDNPFSDITDISDISDTISDEISQDPSSITRFLSQIYPFEDGSCEIKNVTKNLSLTEFDIESKNETVLFLKNTKLNLIKCDKVEENYKSKLVISFRQLNGFYYGYNYITFLFFGMISKDLKKGYQITIEVNLIINGYQERNSRTAICLLKKDVNGNENSPVQGDFNCTILNVGINAGINSFVFNSSKYISGIPEDKVLLNPESTKKYISYGEIIDYSVEKNKQTIIPNFISESINSDECNEKGIFKIKGKLNSDLDDDLNFELPLAYPEEISATCSIKHGKKNTNQEIICETNGRINNTFIMIAQSIIINKNKKELLIINKIEDKKRSNCKNGKTNTLVTKIEIPIPITFRQVNQFNPSKNKATFHFIGIANQFVPFGRKIKMLVYIIINGKKEQKEANCVLNTYTPFNSLIQTYGQVDFYCETNTANKIDDLEIISSDEVLGLNELDDYQKSPNSTDIKIKETETEENLGKVINYSSNQILYDIPPIFNIFDIYINDYNNCEKKGKIRVEADFNKKIDKQFDFIIPLSYPASSIKCTAPKIEANRRVILDCKVQKDFTISHDNIIIEPRIIKKKIKKTFM